MFQWFHKKPNLCLTTDNVTMHRRLRWKMCDQRPRCPATGLPACRLLPPAAGNCRDFSGQQCWNLHSTHTVTQCTVQSTQCWNLPKCTITLCPDAHTVHMVNHTCDSKPHGKTQSKDALLKYCQEESHSIRIQRDATWLTTRIKYLVKTATKLTTPSVAIINDRGHLQCETWTKM